MLINKNNVSVVREFFTFSKSIMKVSLIFGLIGSVPGLFFDALYFYSGLRDISDVLFHLSILVTALGIGLILSLVMFWWVRRFNLNEEGLENGSDTENGA